MKPSELFRDDHKEIREHLAKISNTLATLSANDPARQKEKAKEAVTFFKEHLIPHAQWEERVLYPAVDKKTGTEKFPFTATMRHDHQMVGQWISDMEKLLTASKLDAAHFSQVGFRLLGLLEAHFENEEEVLLPVLDKTMTRAEFDREIMGKK